MSDTSLVDPARAARRARHPALLMAFVLPLGMASAHATPDHPLSAGQTYQLGREARTERDYATMLARWRQAATQGHLPAQEALASTLMVGATLYGPAVPADLCEAAHWAHAAAVQGSTVGAHQQQVLNGLRDRHDGLRACAPATP